MTRAWPFLSKIVLLGLISYEEQSDAVLQGGHAPYMMDDVLVVQRLTREGHATIRWDVCAERT